MFRLTLLLIILACSTAPAAAQVHDSATAESLDREARLLFEAGTTAFDDARYEDALQHFRRAYEISGREGLLYNVGITADRLRRDSEALEAFEGFLERAPADHPRRREVESRVAVLRQTLTSASASTDASQRDESQGDEAPTTASELPPTAPPPRDVGGMNTSPPPADPDAAVRDEGSSSAWLAGPIALGAIGLAGVVASIIGMAGGGCVEMDAAGCVEEDVPSWGAVAAYGGLGLAAIVGGVVWLLVGLSDDGDDGAVSADARGLRWIF